MSNCDYDSSFDIENRNSTMEFAQTIAMARTLLADGRAGNVVRMVEPLLDAPEEDAVPGAGRALLRALMARVHAVHTGDIERALALLAPFEDPTVRRRFPNPVQAETVLWLGWAHARRDETFDEEARALNLLDEAQRLFAAEVNASGRCWALVGQAQAYFAIDEYQLMRQALEKAGELQHTIDDMQLDRWTHDLSVAALRFQGRYDDAQTHVDALAAMADETSDRELQGRAQAYQAALHLDRGHPPERIVAAAERAEALLRRDASGTGYPLLAAYHAHIRALMLQGAWDEAATTIDAAMQAVGPHPTAQAHLQTLRARLALCQHQLERAEAAMEDLFEQAHHLPHGLQRSHVALLRGELLARSGDHDAAQSWMEHAYQNARETGHRGNQLQALLTLAEFAIERGDPDAAAGYLRAIDRYDDYFSVLPFAAHRFRVLGRHAQLDGHVDEARSHFNQALSTYSLIGDANQAEAIRTRLAALPNAKNEAASSTFEATLGTALAHASLSVRLVAETWIQAVEQLLPDRWIGVYRRTEAGAWTCVHERGTPPDALSWPEAAATEPSEDGVRWLLLHTDDVAFYMGCAVSGAEDATWQEAASRIEPWLSVVQLALDRALMRRERSDSLPLTNGRHAPPRLAVDDFIYDSAALRTIARKIDRMRSSYSPVLISGETGVGKTTVARAIHATSERSEGPWHTIHCASAPPDPLETRLFGEGDSTPGLLQQADGGTLLLHEIDALPSSLQTRLLRVLETGTITPPGAAHPLPVDARLLASTTEDLAVKVHEGTFQDDLYYRLNVISLSIPPLRARREDIPVLVRHFLDTLRPAGTPPVSITSRALEALLHYDWPGNVRQLRNEIERALVLISSEPAPTVDVNLFSDPIRAAASSRPPSSLNGWSDILHPDRDLSDVLARTEKDIIECVLAECNGHITASADVLGLTRQGLYKKMKRLEIDPAAFKHDPPPSTASN